MGGKRRFTHIPCCNPPRPPASAATRLRLPVVRPRPKRSFSRVTNSLGWFDLKLSPDASSSPARRTSRPQNIPRTENSSASFAATIFGRSGPSMERACVTQRRTGRCPQRAKTSIGCTRKELDIATARWSARLPRPSRISKWISEGFRIFTAEFESLHRRAELQRYPVPSAQSHVHVYVGLRQPDGRATSMIRALNGEYNLAPSVKLNWVADSKASCPFQQ